MIRFALVVAVLVCYVDARRYVKTPHTVKSHDLVEHIGHAAELKSFIRKSINKIQEVPGLPPQLTDSLQALKYAPKFITTVHRVIQIFQDTAHGGFMSAVTNSLELLKESPELSSAFQSTINIFKSIPGLSLILRNFVKTFAGFTGLSSIANYLLGQIDGAFDTAKQRIARELITHHMEKCKEDEETNVFEFAVDVIKFHDFGTGSKIRREKAEKCFDELRPRVDLAIKKGYIWPLDSPPCSNGWGSFEMENKNKRYFDTTRILPCTDKKTKRTKRED